MDQAQLAEAHQKPVVIHCLKSWDELITLRGIAQPKVPWILHGFRGKPKLAEQMLKHGFYLSFGASLLLANSPSRDSYRMTPINQMFLGSAGRGSLLVNREQDLNDEGLRKAKLSYHPVDFVEKCGVTLALD